MENFEDLKNKLILAIEESSDENLILKLCALINSENRSVVSESPSF